MPRRPPNVPAPRRASAKARQVEAVRHDMVSRTLRFARQLRRRGEMRRRCSDDRVGRRDQAPKKGLIQAQHRPLPHDIAMPADDPRYRAWHERGRQMGHRIGRELQMDQVVRAAVLAMPRVPWHRRADRRATDVQPRPGLNRLPHDRQIWRCAAARNYVGVRHLAFQTARQFEDIAFQPTEVIVGETAESEPANQAARRYVAAVASAQRAQVKLRAQGTRFSASRLWPSRSSRAARTAALKPAWSWGSSVRAQSPASSLRELVFEVTTGTPQASASSTGSPKPS